MHRHRLLLVLLSGAALLAIGASVCFVAQGGFGGGHGDLDRILFGLALPWSLIPWPEPLVTVDFVWLILLPFVLNVAAIAGGVYVVRKVKHRGRPAIGISERH